MSGLGFWVQGLGLYKRCARLAPSSIARKAPCLFAQAGPAIGVGPIALQVIDLLIGLPANALVVRSIVRAAHHPRRASMHSPSKSLD